MCSDVHGERDTGGKLTDGGGDVLGCLSNGTGDTSQKSLEAEGSEKLVESARHARCGTLKTANGLVEGGKLRSDLGQELIDALLVRLGESCLCG